MYKKEQKGFSLAEALITLLIVCLITLASIPILTKKRRNLSDSEHGKYECTMDTIFEEQKDGTFIPVYKYKERYSQTTDKWTYVKSCKFTPPPQARNFAFTVIGGGGGGGDAMSSYTEYINKTSAIEDTFTPEFSDYYDIDIVSGGGGGADGTYSHKDRYQPMCGGAGGSGARIVGVVYLTKGTTYDYKVGGGGGVAYGGYRDSSKRAGSGGSSYFRDRGDNVNFEVSGGEGGQTHNGGYRKRQWGGGVGSGGSVINARGARGVPTKQQGQAAPNNRAANAPDGNYYRAFTDYGAGRGGFGGCKYKYRGTGVSGDSEWSNSYPVGPVFNNGENTPEAGHPGKLLLSLSKKYHGTAGKSAVPVTTFIPSIPSKVKINITIGKGGAPGSNGESSIVEFNSIVGTGLTERRIVGAFGAGGTKNEHIAAAENGENSVWTAKGGGKAGSCRPRQDEPSEECKEVPVFEKTNNCMEFQCATSVDDKGEAQTDTYPTYDEFKKTLKDPETLEEYNLPITALQDEIWAKVKEDLELPADFPDVFANLQSTDDGCYKFNTTVYKKACTAWETKQTGTEKVCKEVPPGPASCEDAENGDQYNQGNYGAGGGGGSGSETPNVASKGGYGANGAVIIEW